MSVLVGDNIGLIKVINVAETKTKNEFYNSDKEGEILFMSHYKNKKWLITCNKNNIVTLFFTKYNQEKNEYNFESKHSIQYENLQESHAIGFNIYAQSGYLIIVQSNGQIYKLNLDFIDGFSMQKRFLIYFILRDKLFQITIPKITKVKKITKSLTQILVLSKGTNPQIWDFEENKLIWKAKNVKNNYLDLQVPIYDLDAAFELKSKEFFTCNAFQKIRKYDYSKQNSKPVKDIELKVEKSAFNNIILSNCGQFLFVSNYLGSIFKLSKEKLTVLQKFKGALGVITQLALNKSEEILFSIGLDRYLRIYNMKENESTQVYLKQKLTAILPFETKTNAIQPQEQAKYVIKHKYYTQDELKYTKKDAKQFQRTSFSIYSKNKEINEDDKEEEEKITKKQKKY